MGRSNYSPEHVRQLVEGYAALLASADTTHIGIRFIVELADLSRAMTRLPLAAKEVVFAHGLVRLSQEETARALQKSQRWVSHTYRDALEDITHFINGGE